MDPYYRLPIKGFVESDTRTLGKDRPLTEVYDLLKKPGSQSTVFVKKPDGKLYGIVTPDDLINFGQVRDTDKATAGDVATKDVVAIREDATLADAISIMNGNNWLKKVVDTLPVLDEKRNTVGILRRDSLLSSLQAMTK